MRVYKYERIIIRRVEHMVKNIICENSPQEKRVKFILTLFFNINKVIIICLIGQT